MDKPNFTKEDIKDFIIKALTINDVNCNSIDYKRIDAIINDYFQYCYNFKTNYVRGELDTFKKAACLLVAINKSRLLLDKRLNAIIAIDAAERMCEHPYWNIGENFDIPHKLEDINIEKFVLTHEEFYNKHQSMLIDALTYGNGVEPISVYLNLELFYRIVLEEQKHRSNTKIDDSKVLLPGGGTTSWMENCKSRNYRCGGYTQNIVCEINISSDSRIVVSDYTQPGSYYQSDRHNAEKIPFYTSVSFFKKELDNHSVYAPNVYDRAYVIYYPYGTRFDEDLLKQIGIALNNLINKARDLKDNLFNKKQLRDVYCHQKKLIELLINGTNDKDVVKMIMYDMDNFPTGDHVREARYGKDWLPHFSESSSSIDDKTVTKENEISFTLKK